MVITRRSLVNLRNALSTVDPLVGAEPFIHGHRVVATGLHVDQEQHVGHGLDDPVE